MIIGIDLGTTNSLVSFFGENGPIIIPNKLQPETFKIEKLWDYETGEEIDSVSPGVKGQKVFMKLPIKCEEGWILRRKKLSKGTPLFDK